ncbi:MAG: IS66 family transposase [Planctomycetota bacterium]|nr:IS66 family transposase [Planctomycetota bacterium]
MRELKPNPACPNCAVLLARIEELEAKLERLSERLNQNSSNSSKPPSSDAPWQKPPAAKKPSGRKPGGQPGHPGHHRVRLPPERVTHVVHYVPHVCAECQAPLSKRPGPHDPPPTWHQVAELPPQPAEITEYQGHARTCPCCGCRTRAEIPPEIQAHALGPNLAAALSYLSGRGHASKRNVQELAETVFGVPLSLGTVIKLEHEMSGALEGPHAQALAAVRGAAFKNVDETGWAKGGKLCWLWVAATRSVAAFQIHAHRGKDGLKALLGACCGILGSDRWGAYAHLPPRQRQICWAHLKRDFQKLIDLGSATQPLGRAGRKTARAVFAAWKDFKDRRCDRAALHGRLQRLSLRFQRPLRLGSSGADPKTKRFCRRVLKVYDALWTFAAVEGIEPTNNHAERMLRPAVLWRKGSFGNHSTAGCRFTERILTTVQTLRLQKRPILDYLRRALAAHRTGAKAPAFLAAVGN